MRPFFNIKATSFFDFKSKLKFKVKPAALLKVTLLDGCFLRFLNCTNGTKLRTALHISLSCNTRHKSSAFNRRSDFEPTLKVGGL